jgi:hypothetical protein
MATGSADATAMMQAYGNASSEHDLLARRQHCAEATYQYTHSELEVLLRRYGPNFVYWQKTADGQTYGHASVLVGVLERSPDLVFHDPENAPHSLMDLSDFNARRQRWKYSQMRREGSPHRIHLYED